MDKQVNDHLEESWEYICERGWNGKLTKKQYINANRPHVKRNIKDGMVPDGNGRYLRDPSIPLYRE